MKIAFDIDDTLIVPSVVTGNRDIPNKVKRIKNSISRKEWNETKHI